MTGELPRLSEMNHTSDEARQRASDLIKIARNLQAHLVSQNTQEDAITITNGGSLNHKFRQADQIVEYNIWYGVDRGEAQISKRISDRDGANGKTIIVYPGLEKPKGKITTSGFDISLSDEQTQAALNNVFMHLSEKLDQLTAPERLAGLVSEILDIDKPGVEPPEHLSGGAAFV